MEQHHEPTHTTTAPPAPSAPRPRTAASLPVLVGAVVAALAAGFGIGWVSHTSDKASTGTGPLVAIHGSLQLVGESNFDAGGGVNCNGIGGFSDISGGVAVTIGDQTGKTLAVTSLDTGHPSGRNCVFSFAAQVPAGATLYTVVISHRGTQTFQPSDISGGFNMSLGTS